MLVLFELLYLCIEASDKESMTRAILTVTHLDNLSLIIYRIRLHHEALGYDFHTAYLACNELQS